MSAVRRLRWDDFDFAGASITLRAENDNRRVKRVVRMPPEFMREVEQFGRVLDSALGGIVFPSTKLPGQPVGRENFHELLVQAETHAGWPKLHGNLWHAYRRRWATGVDGLPQAAAMYAGGWKDARTFLGYKAVTEDDPLSVASKHRSVPSVVGG